MYLKKKNPKPLQCDLLTNKVNSIGTLFAYLAHLALKSNSPKIIIYLLPNQAAPSISRPTLWLLIKSLCSCSATRGWTHENIVWNSVTLCNEWATRPRTHTELCGDAGWSMAFSSISCLITAPTDGVSDQWRNWWKKDLASINTAVINNAHWVTVLYYE